MAEEVRKIQWTTTEESALCQGWVRSSENNAKENSKKVDGVWTKLVSCFEQK